MTSRKIRLYYARYIDCQRESELFLKINFISLFIKTQYKQESKIKVCLIYKNLYQSITTIDKYSKNKLCGSNKNYIRVFQHLRQSCY